MGMEDSLIGHTLGAYRLVDRLGQGGMATVYKAYEAALDRYVAIKVLPQFFANDPTFAQRFRREAKAIAQLNHPNIVPIYSYGEDNGITYIAMQFIEGGTLKHTSDQVYRSEEALRLLQPIARALGYAHKHGVIHRDIKPSNVLISEEGWPVLADFGLAQMAQASAKLTESGVGMGTPTYMSPEQGQGDRVDHRTDIYSFGIMLYELVTGEAPFRADTPMAVVIKHLTAPMPLPSDINPNVPPEVETLILKATAKNPDDRFQSAEELALAMERALNLPSVMKEERKAEHSIPQYTATVAARPPAPTVAAHPPATPAKEPRKPGRILRTLGIALLALFGLPCLCLIGMYAFNICPPAGPWDQPPWCAGSRYVAPFINTPVVEISPAPLAETPPATPVITEGELGDILFQDDFEGDFSPRWMFTSDRYLVPWVADEFEGRTVFHSLPPTPPGEVSAAEIQENTWDNYAIQFDFRFLKPDRFDTHYFSLLGRIAQCSPTIRARQAYEVIVSPDRSLLKKTICKEGGQEEVAVSDWDFDPNEWHTLQYNLVGNRIQLLIDGKTFIDHTDPQDWLIGDSLWIETGADAEILFDNLKVYEIVPLAAPVPEVESPSESPLAKMCAPGQNVLYTEDFEDGEAQNWSSVQGSVAGVKPYGWSIVDDGGNKVLVEAKASSGGDEMAAFKADNFVWRAKFKVIGNDASMFFMWRISQFEGVRKRYVVMLGAQEKPFMIRFTDRATGASPTNIGGGSRDMLEQDIWHDLAISYFNGTHQVWYDGKKQIEYQDPEPFPPGTVGFETHLNESKKTEFFIDDMVICELSAPYEPTP